MSATAATATIVGLSAAPAGAAVTNTVQHTFTDGSGNPRTCSIQLVREYPYNGDPQVGRGATIALTGGDPQFTGCASAIAFIGAEYKDPDGLDVVTEENSDGISTARRYAPVGSAFVTVHSVEYGDCLADCTATFRRPK